MIISGTPDIIIIQGDNYQKKIYFTNFDINLVDSVFFSCKVLNLSKKLDKINTEYFLLSFTSEETEKFAPLKGNYDITVVFTDSKTKTVLYNSFIEILPKINTIQEDSNE
jgi:hypothetical protein